MRTSYLRDAPNPEDFPVLVEKMKASWRKEFAWPDEDSGRSRRRRCSSIGDSDIVRPEHAVELFRLLGGGVPGDLTGLPTSQLAILPGTTHVGVVDQHRSAAGDDRPRFSTRRCRRRGKTLSGRQREMVVGAWVPVGRHERGDGRDGGPDPLGQRVAVAGATITTAGLVPGIFG